MYAPGTVRVEFAGTRVEARALADAHPGITVPNRTSPNGLPFLSLKYSTCESRAVAHTRFEMLGWEREFHEARSTHKPQVKRAA